MIPERPAPKQIPLPKPLALAIAHNLANLNALATEAQAAQRRFESANDVNRQFIQALILGAGFELKDFMNYQMWEDPATGEIFLRPNGVQPPAGLEG